FVPQSRLHRHLLYALPRPPGMTLRRAGRRSVVRWRAMSSPVIVFPPELPVSAAREEIAAAIRDNQVVIVAAAAGSGMTTQLRKICLELGRERIAHTQPRRLAARTIAERVAEELHVELGGLVGYKVRFTDQVSDATRIALMTDGILLNEIHRDRLLRRYDTIIIDEAHERSLNVDFLLGYLHRILPERPDLKVIITSATIDPESFAAHFASPDGEPAPIIEVSGRTYPVEIRYRPLVDDAATPEESAGSAASAPRKAASRTDLRSSAGEDEDEVAAIVTALRSRELRRAFRLARRRTRADHRGLGPHLPGRDPVPPAGRRRRNSGRIRRIRRFRTAQGRFADGSAEFCGRGRGRGRRDRHRAARTRPRGAGRRAGVPARRGRDPRCRRRRPRGVPFLNRPGGGAAAVRAAVRGRTAPS